MAGGDASGGSLTLDDLRGAVSGGGNAKAAQAVVPLWKVKPRAPTVNQRGGRDTADWNAVQDLRKSSPGKFTMDVSSQTGVTAAMAEATWMDMEDKEKLEFLSMARAAGLVGDGKVSPASLASAWAKAVSSAEGYNLAQKGSGKWISPWDAVKRLGLKNLAGAGGAFDGFAQSKAGVSRDRRSNVRTYSAEDLKLAAQSIARELIGKDATPEQLAAATAAVNRASAANPEMTDVTTVTDELGNTTSTQSSSGGIDANAVLTDQVKKNPEHARYQSATTYFAAAMNALNSPVSM